MLLKVIHGNSGNNSSRSDFKNARRDFFIKKALVLKSGTLKEYKTVFKSLDDFEKKESIELTFPVFNQQFFDKYESYLITKKNPTHQERGLLNDTIAKYCSTLKAFLLWAFDNNYHNNRSAFENIKTQIKKKVKNEIVVLSEEELTLLINVDLTAKPYLERVRDLFCFGCYTGQRFSDIMNFSKHDFDGEKWSFVSVKNHKTVNVPIVGFIANARKILEKYDYVLPIISNQKFNDYLKEVGKIAKINTIVKIIRFAGIETVEIIKEKHEFMSSHMARRTFVTLLLTQNVPITVVKELTKHSDIRTLMKYENTSYETIKYALEK